MIVRSLGKSGLRVTAIGLGLAALGRPGYINLGHAQDLKQDYLIASMEANAHSVLDAAWKAGVRYFDAARSYGRAENFLSTWLNSRGIAPDTVTVGSKWGYTYTAGWQIEAEKHEIKDHSLAVLRRQVAESRDLLRPHLDLYQIHSATLESGVLDNKEVLEELARLRDEGLTIGLSLSGSKQSETLRRAMEIRYHERPLFGSVQATWNLLETSAGPALSEAHEAGLGVIVKEALANGRLTSRNTQFGSKNGRRLLEQIATEYGVTIDAIALAVVLRQPWADVALSGATTIDHLNSNVRALDIEISEKTAIRLEELVENPIDYWSTRNDLPWN